MMYERAIVVGASSGIGAELVIQLAARGCKVAAVARRIDRLEALALADPEHIFGYQHDVRDYDAAPAAFAEITKHLGGLDLVIYASGVMPEVGPGEFDFEKDREIIEVNTLGAMAWLDLAAVRFSQVGAGTIVGIGSVAGDRGRAGQPAYHASKAALATYLESLRNRLWKKGVEVVTIKPGPVQTEMTKRLGLKNAMPADKAAELILKKSAKTGEHYLKITHRVIFAIIRLIPGPLFRRLPLP
ncbi:MAG TPA: SDR family NAD(P)-dependent oxidoreductase [Fimbriimonadaceae bacterium]|nr:SDR family NAD(P)-dependent oxidoreductase [Fimbriimonadaceae bacterium]